MVMKTVNTHNFAQHLQRERTVVPVNVGQLFVRHVNVSRWLDMCTDMCTLMTNILQRFGGPLAYSRLCSVCVIRYAIAWTILSFRAICY